MIKTTELRLGNLVYAPDLLGDIEISRVYSITLADVMVQGKEVKHAVGMEMLEPIPISEKWLKILGFYDNGIMGTYQHEEFRLWLHTRTLGPGVFLVTDELTGSIARDFKYVHEIQNLFHAFTGQELTLKETV